jgi:uncharacterized protein (TIGR02231 family)
MQSCTVVHLYIYHQKNNMNITKITLVIGGIIISSSLFAQNAKIIKSELKEVMLYKNSAELSHQANVSLPTGASELVFTHVANGIDENSIQIGSSPHVTVMSVRSAVNYISTDVKSDAYIKAENYFKKESNILANFKNQKATEESILKLLESNQKIAGVNGNTTVAELAKMADYYKTKYLEVKSNITALDDHILLQQNLVNKAQVQLEEVKGQTTGSGGQLIVQVMNNQAGNQPFDITYTSSAASWSASYDLRSAHTSSPLAIIYKANVTQETGIDWKQVHLILASGNPAQYGIVPNLTPWQLYYNQPVQALPQALQGRVAGIAVEEVAMDEVNAGMKKNMLARSKSSINSYTQQNENQLNTTFDIAIPYDIASNGKPHSVSLKEYTHPATYSYIAIPRIDPNVYLMAELTDYEKLNLLPGTANVMFENMLVGKTYINPNDATDTLKMSMGRDKMISIKRDKINDLSQTKILGSSKKQSLVYEITIKNNKKNGVTLSLQDQIPIATDKSMEITLDDHSGADVEKETGLLKWNVTVPAGTTQKIRFGYSVKYPKDKLVSIY